MSSGTIPALAATLRRFIAHRGGSMTIPAIVFFAALMGVGGLAIDLQRYYGVHGQQQTYVDDVALAAAAELDGQAGAITRAVDAATGGSSGPLLTSTGWQSFATSNTFTVRKLIFLSQLGSPDPSPIDAAEPHAVDSSYVLCTVTGGTATPGGCDTNANNEKNAKFVEVLASPRTVSYIVLPIANVFGQVFGSSNLNPQVALRATAGFKAAVCDLNPLMICNPAEPLGNTNQNLAFDATAFIGKQILLTAGGGSAWAPGNFGWVQVPSNAGTVDCAQGGNQDTSCIMALVDPLTQCLPTNTIGVNTIPGNSSEPYDALNVRFDIYPNNNRIGPLNNVSTDPRTAPSANVTKGVCDANSGTCDYAGTTTCPNPNGNGNGAFDLSSGILITNANARAQKLPRDSQWCTDGTFTSCVGAPDATHRFGTGMTAAQATAYWVANHYNDVSLPSPLQTKANNGTLTRWDIYRHEIDCQTGALLSGCSAHDGIPNYSSSSNDGENGGHIGSGNGKWCSNQAGVDNVSRDRRTLFVAVVNCIAGGLNGNSVNNIPVVAYLKVFLTEPVGFDLTGAWNGPASTKNVFGEVIDVVKPNDPSGIVHVYPVLYR